MLPAQFRFWLFDRMSVKTMRYVSAVPDRQAVGIMNRWAKIVCAQLVMHTLEEHAAEGSNADLLYVASREQYGFHINHRHFAGRDMKCVGASDRGAIK